MGVLEIKPAVAWWCVKAAWLCNPEAGHGSSGSDGAQHRKNSMPAAFSTAVQCRYGSH